MFTALLHCRGRANLQSWESLLIRNSEVLGFGVEGERTDSAMRVCWEKGVTQEEGRVRVTGSGTLNP